MTLRGFVVVSGVDGAVCGDGRPHYAPPASGLSTMTPPSGDPTELSLESTAFWSNASWDGPLMGVARSRSTHINTENLEYLHNRPTERPAGFRFDEEILNQTCLFGITSRTTESSGETNSVPLRMTAERAASSNSGTTANSSRSSVVVRQEGRRAISSASRTFSSPSGDTDRDYNDYVHTRFETKAGT